MQPHLSRVETSRLKRDVVIAYRVQRGVQVRDAEGVSLPRRAFEGRAFRRLHVLGFSGSLGWAEVSYNSRFRRAS
jgi:hypothetical protein